MAGPEVTLLNAARPNDESFVVNGDMPELGKPLVIPPSPTRREEVETGSSTGPPPPPSPSSKPPVKPRKPPELALNTKPQSLTETQQVLESTHLATATPPTRPSHSSSRSVSLRSIISLPRASSSSDLANKKGSTSSSRSSIREPSPPPPTRAPKPSPPSKASKPRWLQRASMAGVKVHTPVLSSYEGGNLDEIVHQDTFPKGTAPPALPSRPKPSSQRMMPPPPPAHPASAAMTTSTSTGRDMRRPATQAYSSSSSLPRDGFTAIRGRLAAWGSETADQQRLPASAQKALNTAGSAVSRGWAGLRARGAGTGASISGLSSLAGPSTGGSRYDGSFRRGSADAGVGAEGPTFGSGIVKRAGKGRASKVFGRDLDQLAGTNLTVIAADEDLNAFQRQRRACLPAVLVRSVEHLHVWAVKEEGIFRISGRSSHIAKLRAEFDAGSDLDLKNCDPGDLDPHAVAGLYKAFLRELPSPILHPDHSPDFDRLVKACMGRTARDVDFGVTAEKNSLDSSDGEGSSTMKTGQMVIELERLLRKLPEINWFLLADLASLLASTIDNSNINKMTLQNVLLVFCPSLSFSAPFLRVLIEHRHSLFVNPPDAPLPNVSFDEAELLPPVLPSRPSTSSVATPPVEEQVSRRSSFRRSPPKLAKRKSSLSILMSTSQSAPGPRTPPPIMERSPSVVQITPPRVELSAMSTSPLPSFEGQFKPAPSLFDALDRHVVSAKDEAPEAAVSPPAGIVADRAKAFSTTQTPIADRFAGTGIPAASLFTKGSLAGASASTGHLPEFGFKKEAQNPASIVRRGQPVFFSSSASSSARPSRSRTVPANLNVAALPESDDSSSWKISAEGNKRKSLSPGGRGVRNAITMLETSS